MSDESASASPGKSKKTWQSKAVGIGILVLIVGYVLFRPSLEKWLGVSLPSITNSNQQADNPNDNNSNTDPKPNDGQSGNSNSPNGSPNGGSSDGSEGPLLTKLQDGGAKLQSGLVFPGSRNGETRLEHVMRHDDDQPNRSGMHGVFDGDETDLLEVVDEAYEMILNKSPRVRAKKEGARTVYDVDMQRRIGFVGGRVGAERRHPAARKVRLVLEGNKVITAYPMK
jgi:hypothetical protein